MEKINKFKNLKESLYQFINSPLYIFIVGLITVISATFALEVVCFTLLALLGVTSLIVSEDTKPTIPIMLTALFAMSYKNGISYNPNRDLPTIYDNKIILGYFVFLIVLILGGFIYNFIKYKQYKKLFNRSLIFLPGLILLSLGYLLGGIIDFASLNNFLYPFTNVILIVIPFIYYADTAFIDNSKISPIKYLSLIMVMTTLVIGLEMVHIYLTNDVIQGFEIIKGNIKNGWGLQNNFAGYFVLSVPFTVYLIISETKPLRYYLFLLLTCILVFFTMARTSYITLLLELIIAFFVICHVKKVKIKYILIFLLSLVLTLVVLALIFHDEFLKLFNSLIEIGLSLNGREKLFQIAWDSFMNHPIFGEGWFNADHIWSDSPYNMDFIPDWKIHNVVLQLLGSTGIFGFICFLIFIYNLFIVNKHHFSVYKLVPTLGIMVLLFTSLGDNFFFDYTFERYMAIFLVVIGYYYFNGSKVSLEK